MSWTFRSAGWQQLWFPDAESQETFHQSLGPLLKWFDTLPSGNRTQLSEDEGKNNCLPPRSEGAKLAAREGTVRSAAVKGSPSIPDSYMLRIVFDELSPGVAKRTCAIIYPNGFYHLEKSREKYYSEGVYRPDIVNPAAGGKIKALVFEQFLDSIATAELRKPLDNPTLIASRHSTLPTGIHYSEANITMVYIPREGMVQQLAFTNYFGGENGPTAYGTTGRIQHIDSAADLLSPLQRWMKTNIEARKAAQLTEAFGNNCTFVPTSQLPTEISSELAQVVPPDFDSDSAEADKPIITKAQSSALSSIPTSPTAPQVLDERKTAENEPAISLRVTTRMVLLDVIATDKNEKPIPDLQRGDIQILEDGRPQDVKFFSHTSRDTERNEKRNAPPLPPSVYSNRPDYSRPTGPLVLILLDGVNTAGLDQAYARRQMLDYVRTLKSDQRVAILALTTDLLLLQDFTTDPQVLKAALEKYTASDSPLLSRGVPAQISPQTAEILAWGAPALLSNLRRTNQESAINSTDARVRLTMAALQALARAMIGYPGRKNLIWVSSGFPLSIQLGGKNFALSQSYAGELAEASKLLSQAQVSVYPVDARGLIGNVQQPPGSPGSSDPFSDPVSDIVPTVGSLSDGVYGTEELTRISPLVTESHMAMQQIAQDTGGRAFYNANNLTAAVAKSVADGSSYYTIGYYPQNKVWDGKFRTIVIKTARSHVRLRYRTGYYAFDAGHLAKSPDPLHESNRVRELVTAIKNPLPSTGVGFWAHLMPPSQTDPSSYVEFLVDAKTISFAATGEKYECNLDYAVLTVTTNGGITSTSVKTVQASLPASAYTTVRKRGLPYRLLLKSVPEQGSLRLAVRDNTTGLIGTLTIPIPASSAQADQGHSR